MARCELVLEVLLLIGDVREIGPPIPRGKFHHEPDWVSCHEKGDGRAAPPRWKPIEELNHAEGFDSSIEDHYRVLERLYQNCNFFCCVVGEVDIDAEYDSPYSSKEGTEDEEIFWIKSVVRYVPEQEPTQNICNPLKLLNERLRWGFDGGVVDLHIVE